MGIMTQKNPASKNIGVSSKQVMKAENFNYYHIMQSYKNVSGNHNSGRDHLSAQKKSTEMSHSN